MTNSGIIITLAYPDTIVRISDERYVSYLKYINVGCENYIRAGHAALVLIEKTSGKLDYYDFGRYTCPIGFGRVRGSKTDHELDFPLHAEMEQGKVRNLNEILSFLATNSRLTHGDGKLVASVCSEIDYKKAREFILNLQKNDFVRYGAFLKKGSNCSRFVTETLINSITNFKKKKQLAKSKRFTPSTISNVVLADTEKLVYEIDVTGEISEFKSTIKAENRRCFLDKLVDFNPNLIGNLKPKPIDEISNHAQWLEGIGAGAWFELHKTDTDCIYTFRRISPYGNLDVEANFLMDNSTFNYELPYQFIHFSNCSFFHLKQNETIFRFDKKVEINLTQKVRLA